MDLNRLKSSLQGETYQDLRAFFQMHIDDMKNIDNVKEYSKAVDQAVELKAQKKARVKLQQMLEQIVELAGGKDKPKPKANDYGV